MQTFRFVAWTDGLTTIANMLNLSRHVFTLVTAYQRIYGLASMALVTAAVAARDEEGIPVVALDVVGALRPRVHPLPPGAALEVNFVHNVSPSVIAKTVCRLASLLRLCVA